MNFNDELADRSKFWNYSFVTLILIPKINHRITNFDKLFYVQQYSNEIYIIAQNYWLATTKIAKANQNCRLIFTALLLRLSNCETRPQLRVCNSDLLCMSRVFLKFDPKFLKHDESELRATVRRTRDRSDGEESNGSRRILSSRLVKAYVWTSSGRFVDCYDR